MSNLAIKYYNQKSPARKNDGMTGLQSILTEQPKVPTSYKQERENFKYKLTETFGWNEEDFEYKSNYNQFFTVRNTKKAPKKFYGQAPARQLINI